MINGLMSLLSGIYLVHMGLEIKKNGTFVMRWINLDFSNFRLLASYIFIFFGLLFIINSIYLFTKIVNKKY